MSNTKNVYIAGEVPFNWLMFDGMPEADAAFMASYLLAPSGLSLEYGASHMVPNERGGQNTIYAITISGIEAVSYPALDRIIEIIEGQGTCFTAEASDLDDPHGTADLLASRSKT